eukprot:2735649-Prymnesium_polylepis.1
MKPSPSSTPSAGDEPPLSAPSAGGTAGRGSSVVSPCCAVSAMSAPSAASAREICPSRSACA